ncbi:MAG: peptide chain release factor-like protein [Thermoguttaceae bacterium]
MTLPSSHLFDHPAAIPAERLLADCDIRFVRRSGPGGQHRNKVATAVVLHHRPSGVVAEASERRSQAENRAVAIRRLRINLALQLRTDRDPAAASSSLWRSRCDGGRLTVSAAHDDFPTLLAEALDVLTAFGFDTRPAAELLGCTASQLVKFLQKEPRAMVLVNEKRTASGLRPLL